MKSICLFSSYFSGAEIPFYVQYYISSIRKHFTDFVFIHSKNSLNSSSKQFLQEQLVEEMEVENEGYDFGMWYKAMLSKSILSYERLALINDSCILFRNMDSEFEKINSMKDDYIGMVITDRYSTHLQSYFIIVNGKCVQAVVNYFLETKIINEYREVIQKYEIGLCKFLLASGFSIRSLYNIEGRAHEMNPSFSLLPTLIDEGIPMIKKKIVFRNYKLMEYYWLLTMNFNADYRKYIKQIEKKYGKANVIDFDRVLLDAPKQSLNDIRLYELVRKIVRILGYVPGFPWLFNQSRKFAKKFRN